MVDFMDLHRAFGYQQYKEVLSEGNSGGLAMFWNEDVNVQIQTSSAHHIDLVVSGNPGEQQWRLIGSYGYAQTGDRDRSWDLLRSLSDLDSLPWVVLRDFNEILNSSEKIDGPVRAERQMRGFREALGYGDLLDLGFYGPMCTWWNSETQLRLDRAVCTPSWCDLFGHARVHNLPPSDSDHAPFLPQASTVPILQCLRHHRFKFEAYWVQHVECNGIVKDAWNTDVKGTPMFCVMKKIMHTHLRQRKNMLQELYDEEGGWCEDDKGMENIVTSYFSKMFAAQDLDHEAVITTLAVLQPCVSPEMNNQLCAPYNQEELRVLCFKFQSFLQSGQLLRQINFTHICLIPKVSNPERMSDLRPIALCNVIYKICSKVVANRLKLVLPHVISPFQSPFVPGHLITDNILVANEIAHFVHNKREGREGAEGFSALIQQKQEQGLLPSIEVCDSAQSVTHLLFADDSMLYAQASLEACYEIQEVIETYGRASGQLVNFNKSSVVFSGNVSEALKACLHAIRFAAEHGFSPAILETDALEVQRQLSSASVTNSSALGRLYDDLPFMLEDLGNVRIVYIGRKANMVAHLLVAHGHDLVQDTFYFSTPSFLMAAVAADFSSL
ncbi:uncharacterized protein LOC133744796 [Rosa rugosa]|uniref:uncharacterized protein LOC133744796 n=1 Tax=Rosa rugosa TaxID=74645 RepID=UPI002B40768F|nr:uncharacterized protein LOC133744796 [Rosa rugosa]